MKGFTLIELLIVAGIIAFLAAGLTGAVGQLGRTSDLEGVQQSIEGILAESRRRTLSSDGRQSFGVHFDAAAEAVTMFPGDGYDPANAENETVSLPGGVDLTDVTLAGGVVDVVFQRLEGTASADGFVRLRSRRDPAEERTLYLLPSGHISRSAPPAPSGAGRMADTRHVHFNLGWSIQGGGTMQLRFFNPPDADVVENVEMNCCYTANQSAFDWTGTVTVGGSSQTLRIHTHTLTPSDTLLSVHRDRRENDKAVRISVRGRDIANFSADGTLTVLSFGGSADVQ